MRFFSLTAVALCCVFSTIQGLPFKPVVKSSEKKSILPTCSLCNLAVRGVFQSFDIGLTNEDIVDNIALTCISLNLYDEEICRGVATAAIPTIRYIHSNSLVDPGNICGILMQEANCTFSDRDKLEWSIAPSLIPKPEIVQLDSPSVNLLSQMHQRSKFFIWLIPIGTQNIWRVPTRTVASLSAVGHLRV